MQYEIFNAAQSIPLIECRMDGWGRKTQLAWILSKCHVDNQIMLTALSLGELITFIHKHYSNLKQNVAEFLSENQANNS